MADNFKYSSINGVILETDKSLADLEDLHYPSINGAILGKVAAAAGGNIKTYQGIVVASVKTINGLAIASVKTYNGLAK